MQFSVTRMEAQGDGLWRKALELTRARLQADGLLDPSSAASPAPRRVAVITSRDGAALRDIFAVVQRRCPSVEVVLVPAAVQVTPPGVAVLRARPGGPMGRCRRADHRSRRWRAGGPLGVQRRAVARALAACPIPTISAVGHEIDMSICDLVADLRAATPSAAAEAAVPVQAEAPRAARASAAALSMLASQRVARLTTPRSTPLTASRTALRGESNDGAWS